MINLGYLKYLNMFTSVGTLVNTYLILMTDEYKIIYYNTLYNIIISNVLCMVSNNTDDVHYVLLKQ